MVNACNLRRVGQLNTATGIPTRAAAAAFLSAALATFLPSSALVHPQFADVVQCLLVDVREDVVVPSGRLLQAKTAVRIADPAHHQPPLGNHVCADSCDMNPMAICFKLLPHWTRRAASRTDSTAGQEQGDKHADDGNDDQQFD